MRLRQRLWQRRLWSPQQGRLIHRFQTERPAHAFTAVSFAQQFIVAGCRSLRRCMACYSTCQHGMAIDLSISRRQWHSPYATVWAGLGCKWRVSSGKQRSVGTMQRRATTCIMQHAAACNSRHGRALTAERCARAGSDDGSLHIWDDRRYRVPAPIRVATLWRRINVDHAL